MQLPELLDRAISLLYPQRCMRCDGLVEYDDFFCDSCTGQTAGQVIIPFAHGLADVAAVYKYRGYGRGLVWAIKEGTPKRVRYILGYEMHALLNERWGDVAFDMIVPVPATKAKLEAKGFNHAELLAEPLGRMAGISVCPDALVRVESSRVQHNLSRAERRENAELSYQAGQADELAGKTVLLVDDLLTTGSTLAACAERLLARGATAVYALAGATTPSR